jgi:hypothetical protein
LRPRIAGDKQAPEPKAAYSIFDKTNLESQVEKLKTEIEALKEKSETRKIGRTEDVSMVSEADLSMS